MRKMRKSICCIIIAALFLLTLLPVAASAASMDTRTLAAINKPGVVMVYTEWTATMTLYEFSLDDSLFEVLSEQVAVMVEEGYLSPDDNTALYSTIVQLLTAQMQDYAYYTGNVETLQVSTGATGTGFLVTPDGYLVTNAHVVETNEDELYYSFAVNNLNELAVYAVTELLEGFRRERYEMSQQEIDAMYSAYFNLLASSFEIGNLKTSYTCFQGNVQPGSDISVKGIGLDLRKVGMPSSSRDVAILKMAGSNLPTVPLGDDSSLRTGDTIYAMGYPGVATTSGVVSAPQAMQEPTLTSGIVSAKKQWNDGGDIIQMDADITHGNSGGPLFNAQGEVVGINTFGLTQDGQQVSGMNFAVPISTVKVYLNEINVTPSESKFTQDFKAALAAYNEGDYSTALELVRGINETNPGYPVVQELLADARRAADANPQPPASAQPAESTAPVESMLPTESAAPQETGRAALADPGPSTGIPSDDGIPVWILIAAGAAVLITVIVITLVVSSKRKKAAAPPPYTKAAPFPGAQMQGSQPFRPSAGPAVCRKCSVPLSMGAKFCDNCGQPVEAPTSAVCSNCGEELKQGAKFCNACGAKQI